MLCLVEIDLVDHWGNLQHLESLWQLRPKQWRQPMDKEGVAHTKLNFPIGVAWKIDEINLFSYIKKNYLKLMSWLHIFKTWVLKSIYCWKYANDLNLNQAKGNFPEFHPSNKGVSRTSRKTAFRSKITFAITPSSRLLLKNLVSLRHIFIILNKWIQKL